MEDRVVLEAEWAGEDGDCCGALRLLPKGEAGDADLTGIACVEDP